jgi:4-aminobutyrate aminotransferase/(S)-3-amino-2-methylpropionate transaminase
VAVEAKSIKMVTEFPGPKSKAILERKDKVVAGALSIHVPAVIKEAHGALITDVDGNSYVDLAGGFGCMNVGHSHPKVVKAIQDAAANFTHTDFSFVPYEGYVRLAERLCALAPGKWAKKAAFFNAGAEAVENSIKLARRYTKKTGVIALEGAFHGRTNLCMALTSKVKPYKQGYGPFAPDIYRVPVPYSYRRPEGITEAEYVKRCGDALERAFITQVSPDDCAAIIFEPLQGEGGFVPLHPDYLRRMQDLARKHNIVLIADEIQSGYGRTGTFLACEQLGIEPDLILVAKSMGAGLPISGVIGRKEILDSAPDSSIGGTYPGNPVACAAALAVLDVFEEEGLVNRARELGDLFRRRFGALQRKLEAIPGGKVHIGDIRGLGAMVGIELVKDLKTKEPASAEINAIMGKAMAKGTLVIKCGIYGNVLRMLVPLVIPFELLNEALDVLDGAVVEVAGGK